MNIKPKKFISDLFEYTETDVFENMLTDYCKAKWIDYNDVFHEGGRAGFIIAMSMHFSSKNKKTSTFLNEWVKEMASVYDQRLESN
ncbi:MAG: hypothetical protein ACI8ZB_003291 [Desulforhopalus sp.]|jgi:hypothetical protein